MTVDGLRQGQAEVLGETVDLTSSCFAMILDPDGSWKIDDGESLEDGQLCMYKRIGVLLAACNKKPGADDDGEPSTTVKNLERYITAPLAKFAPEELRVGFIFMNAIPGVYAVREHLRFRPDRGVVGIGGRSVEQTRRLADAVVKKALDNNSGLSVDVHSGKVDKSLDDQTRTSCRWTGKHPCTLTGPHVNYIQQVFTDVGLTCFDGDVFDPLCAQLYDVSRQATTDFRVDECMATIWNAVERTPLREGQRVILRDILDRYKRGASGVVVWAPAGFGKTPIARDVCRALCERFDRIIVLTTNNLRDQTESVVKTAFVDGKMQVLAYTTPKEKLPPPSKTLKTLVVADECTKSFETWRNWIAENAETTFRVCLTATPLGSSLENLLDLASLVMEIPETAKAIACYSLHKVVRGSGVDDRGGAVADEDKSAALNFHRFVDRTFVKARPDDVANLLENSVGNVESVQTLVHVGEQIQNMQKVLVGHAKELKSSNVPYLQSVMEIAPNAALACLTASDADKWLAGELRSQYTGLVVSPLEDELFEILKAEIEAGRTSLVMFPSYVAAACRYLHSAIGMRLGDFSRIGYIDATVNHAARLVLLDRFKNGKLKVLFATTMIAGYGFDFDMVSSTIMMTSPWTAEEWIQTTGRAVRIGMETAAPSPPGSGTPKRLIEIGGYSSVASTSMARKGRSRLRAWLHTWLFKDPVTEAFFGNSLPLRYRDSFLYIGKKHAARYAEDDGDGARLVSALGGDGLRNLSGTQMVEKLRPVVGGTHADGRLDFLAGRTSRTSPQKVSADDMDEEDDDADDDASGDANDEEDDEEDGDANGDAAVDGAATVVDGMRTEAESMRMYHCEWLKKEFEKDVPENVTAKVTQIGDRMETVWEPVWEPSEKETIMLKNTSHPLRNKIIFASRLYNGEITWPDPNARINGTRQEALDYGRENEANALAWLERECGAKYVERGGAYTYFNADGNLAATPDAITTNGYVVEVKCITKMDALNRLCGYNTHMSTGSFFEPLKRYGDQIQAQMECTGLDAGVLVMYHHDNDGGKGCVLILKRDTEWYAGKRNSFDNKILGRSLR